MKPLVLVTGGAGFIGSNIVAELCAGGDYDVAVCDRLQTAVGGKWRNLARRPIVDLVAPEALFDWLHAHRSQLHAVVHMAAISSTVEPDADLILHTNFGLSKRLWDWCAEADVRLIYASSAATYGDGSQGFLDTDEETSLAALRPLNPYGWSKALFDLYARRAADLGRAPPQWAGLKFFNVYGPNEYHKGEMRSVACKAWPTVAGGGAVRLFKSHRADVEDGGQSRDFVHVFDGAKVVAWLLENPKVNGVYNLGTGKARSFKALAEALFTAAGRAPDIAYIDTPEDIQSQYQYFTQAHMSRLRTAGYDRPFLSLEDGIGGYVRDYLSADDPYR